jgi:holo-[acyl-carrier protein] synthase
VIKGLGIDLVELDRVRRSLERFGERFAARVLTGEELASLPGAKARVPYLAARFAAKEAAAKALGTGLSRGIGFHSFAVANLDSGAPALELRGAALSRMRELGASAAHLSLTHGRDAAAAVVILEGP